MSTTSTKRKRRPRLKGKERLALESRWHPRLLTEADSRRTLVKEIRQRAEMLANDCGVDSFQKQMLAEEAVFLHLMLETVKTEMAEGLTPTLEMGQYVQVANALSGLLTKLGLERAIPKADTFEDYLSSKK